jgi:diguanylate cyclase (GGDEF)-like protein
MDHWLLLLAVVLQSAAAAVSIQNVGWRSPYAKAWAVLSATLVLMTTRRFLPLMSVHGVSPAVVERAQNVVGLLISVGALVSVLGLEALVAELGRKDLDLRRSNAELTRLATYDALTGALNRRELLARIRTELTRAERYRHPVAFVLFDLDHFKEVNDRFGHAMGDRALVAFVRTVQRAARANDSLGRLGGEEFGLLLPESDVEGALRLADRMRAEVAALSIEEDERACHITVSAGVALAAPGDELTPDELVRRADFALYAAKLAGRDRVRLHDETTPRPSG